MLAFISPRIAGANTSSFTYEGYLTDAHGEPVGKNGAETVSLGFQIYGSSGSECLLYSESRSAAVDNGHFAVRVGAPGAIATNAFVGSLAKVFGAGTLVGSGGCSFDPAQAGADRILRVTVNGENLGDVTLAAAPMAMTAASAERMGGHSAQSLLRVEDAGSPSAVTPLSRAEHDELRALVSGGSSLYLTGGSSFAGDVTGVPGSTVVTRLRGREVADSVPGDGQALVWNLATSRWEPGTVSGGGGTTTWSTLAGKPLNFPPSAHSHPINEISSALGLYFNYAPNGTACASGEVLKWDTGGGGRWICGTDISGGGTGAVAGTGAITVDSSDPENTLIGVVEASTSAKGVVQLASSSDNGAGLVVQANDTRLANGRAPTGAAGGELSGNYPNPTVVASVSSSASSLVRRSAGGQIQSASADFGAVGVNNGGGSVVTIQAPAAFISYDLKLPASSGLNGQILTSNGTDMVWSNASSITAGNVSGIVAVANGGTGASTASAARTNLGMTATGSALVTATDAATARSAISAMQNVTPGTNGNVLTASGGVWTSAPFTVNAANVGSSVGGYFSYKPNNGACAVGEVLKWSASNGGSWICGTDTSSTGGSGVASVSATAPITVDETDPNNPRVEISSASTSAVGVVQLGTSSDTTAGLVVQANDTRLTNSRAPSGAAGGDLGGNYPNPTIAKLQTKDITLTTLVNGNILKYDGTKWVNAADADSLGGLSCANGDVALYASGAWSCVTASTGNSNNSLVRRDSSGLITSNGGNFGSLKLNNGGGSGITLVTPAAFSSYVLRLPADTGANGQILTSNGTDMVWSSASSITAGSVSGTVAIANGGTGASSAAAARTNLGATATGSSLFTAADASSARSSIGALSSADTRMAPVPAAGNALNYVRVNSAGTAYETRTSGQALSDLGAMAAVAPGSSGNVLISNGSAWVSGPAPVSSGAITGGPAVAAGASTTVNFANSNIAFSTLSCSTFNLLNLKDGGSYTLFVQGTTSQTCGFNAYSGASVGSGPLTVRLPMDHGPTLAGRQTAYNFVVAGSTVYVFWQTGY